MTREPKAAEDITYLRPSKGWTALDLGEVWSYRETWTALTTPLFVLLAVLTALAVDLWLSAQNVRYRDIRYAIPSVVNVWMFATPIAYPSSLVPEPSGAVK
ncbi:MAG: hypothetical protein Q8R28_09615 [Dehalococcoidia bacterium]|nr:hypothetical protein [Dehalococcoidia bacterium]